MKRKSGKALLFCHTESKGKGNKASEKLNRQGQKLALETPAAGRRSDDPRTDGKSAWLAHITYSPFAVRSYGYEPSKEIEPFLEYPNLLK